MKLARVDFENVMELEGSIEFPEGKAVIVYGENKAGKSNIIHALRYAFLSKVVGSRRASGYDELKLVTSREMAPAEGVGKITVDFEHDGRQFEIRREIDRNRDDNRILRKEADGFRELDFAKTVKRELRAGLLDALFAPDSAMGFKHLNEKNIDAVVRELFKEIGNAKVYAERFKQRVQQLREEAAVRVAGIQTDYYSFVAWLRERLSEVPVDLKVFETYDAGRTSEKIGDVANGLRGYIDSLEKGELKEWISDMRRRAQEAEDVEELLGKDMGLGGCFKRVEEIREDKESLDLLMAALRETKLGAPVPGLPDDFHDAELDRQAKGICQRLEEAQARYSSAQKLAGEEMIDLNTENPARIKSDKEKVLALLGMEVLTADAPKVQVDLVKISSEHGEESVHGLIPLKLMDDDAAFTRLSPEPIPEAPEEQKREYARILRRRIENLTTICEDKGRAEAFFEGEFASSLAHISRYDAALAENERREKETISNAVKQVHSRLLLFAQEHVGMPELGSEEDLKPFLRGVRELLSRKKSDYQSAISDKVKNLGMQAGEFSTREMDGLLSQIVAMEKDIPQHRAVWAELTKQRRAEWESNDAEHADLACVPAVVDGIDRALGAILDNAFDEQEVMDGIQEIIVDINARLTGEDLIKSCIEMGKGSLQLSKTIYKGREITHPCGAERSFFSLAALTALARYFRLPVIIDEAANNLDKNHLRHFIRLIREFASSYDVQYILSIKETDDFPIDGWVREFADDVQIYRVAYDDQKKYIRPVDLYA